jgi:hypothetical protein
MGTKRIAVKLRIDNCQKMCIIIIIIIRYVLSHPGVAGATRTVGSMSCFFRFIFDTKQLKSSKPLTYILMTYFCSSSSPLTY